MKVLRWSPDGLPAELLAEIDMPTNPDSDGCWIFTGKLNDGGYGIMRVQIPGRRWSVQYVSVHRFVYEVTKQIRIPGRMGGEECELDHACHNPACCNPGHLTPVPKSVNLRNRRNVRASR